MSANDITQLALNLIDGISSEPLKHENLRRSLPRDIYVRDHRTITLKLTRASGHTTAAIWLKQQLPHSALIVSNAQMVIEAGYLVGTTELITSHYSAIKNHTLRGRKITVVIIDDASVANVPEIMLETAINDPIYVLLN